MTEMIQFVANYEDLSSDRGYQFKFNCDKCGNGYMSPFETSILGTGAGLLLGSVEALRVLAWACILLLIAGIRNTWDMVVWLMILKDDPSKK